MDTQLNTIVSQPLPIVLLFVGLLVVCAVTLLVLIVADRLVEARAARLARGQSLQLSFESLISELTAYA